MAISIKLKSDIDALLYSDPVEVNGETYFHTDFVCLTPEVKSALGTTIDAGFVNLLHDEITDPIYGIPLFTYTLPSGVVRKIHTSWVESVNGEEIVLPITVTNTKFVLLTKASAYSFEDNVIVPLSALPICVSCGAPIDHDSEHKVCDNCLTTTYFSIRNYNFKPDYKYYGTQAGTHAKRHPMWYGLELEYGLNSKREMGLLCFQYPELYLKSDSSISGGNYSAEMVSHPASFDYLTGPDSWVHKLDTLDAVNNPSKNGCHIHISRSAFRDDKHYAKFKYLLHSNIALVEAIGGRGLTSYCQANAPIRSLFKTQKSSKGGERNVLLNENNDNTFELRFMASTTKPKQVLRYIEFIDSLIKYTAYHFDTATLEQYFSSYLTKYKLKYPNIYKFLSTRKDKLEGSVTYKTPEFVSSALPSVSYSQLLTATKFEIDGHSYTVPSSFSEVCKVDNQDNVVRLFGIDISPTPADKIIVTYIK